MAFILAFICGLLCNLFWGGFFCFGQFPPLCSYGFLHADETWKEKINKSFYNTETVVSTGGYRYGVRGTNLFLTEDSVIGVKERMRVVQDLHNFLTSDEDTGRSRKKPVTGDQVRCMCVCLSLVYQDLPTTTICFIFLLF